MSDSEESEDESAPTTQPVHIDVAKLLKWASDRVGLNMTLEAVLKTDVMLYTSRESLSRYMSKYFNVIFALWEKRRGAVTAIDPHFWLRALTKYATSAKDKTSARMKKLQGIARELGHENGRLPPLPVPHRFTETKEYTAKDVARAGCKIVFKGENVAMRIVDGKHGFPRVFLNGKDIMPLFRNGVANLSSLCLVQTSPVEPTNVLLFLDVQCVSWMSETAWRFVIARTAQLPRPRLFPVSSTPVYYKLSFSEQWYYQLPIFEPPLQADGDDDVRVLDERRVTPAPATTSTPVTTLDPDFGDAGSDSEPAPPLNAVLTTDDDICPISGTPISYAAVSAVCNNVRHRFDARSFLLLRDQTKEGRYFKCPVCGTHLSLLDLRRIPHTL